MKKFLFKLTPLLKHRKQEEHLQRKDLFLAHTHLQHLITQLDKLEQESDDLNDQIRKKTSVKLHPPEIASFFTYLDVIKKQMDRQKGEIEKARETLEQRREIVIEAMQKRKIVENLQEKQSSAWESSQQEKEKNFFDELATIRFMRDKLKE